MPVMQWHFLVGLGAKRLRIPLLWQLNKGPMDRDGFTIRMCQLRPESRGRVALRSDDPADRVRIFANYYSTENDRRSFRDGLRMARDLVAQPAFEGWRGAELNPGVEVRSDADIDAYVRRIAETIYHPVGTCRMGVDDDAVVDPELKVRGLEGLRVIDASVMPSITSGNTNTPTIMIAAKGAAMVKRR